MARRLLFLLGLLFALAATAADFVMEIVPLRHRLVAEVLPTLRELVEPGGTVTGLNDRLIMRSTPANIAELKQVLAAIDTRQRQLRITVRQGVAASSQWRQDELAARVGSAGVSGAVAPPGPGPLTGPGAGIAIGGEDAAFAYRHYSTQGADDSANTHFVTAVEGTPAFIGGGQLLPLPQQSAVLTPFGATVQQSLDYRPVGAGFYVTPRLAGDIVHLDISPFADRLDSRGGGQIAQHGMDTVASGRLGEWIPLGGAGESFNSAGSGLVHGTRRAGSSSYDVWVKVDVVP